MGDRPLVSSRPDQGADGEPDRFVESLLIALCFLPVAARVRRELRHLPLRQWIAMGIIAVGAQAFATVLFTQALSHAFPAHAAPDFNVENEVYLFYMLQPVFGIATARIFLKERRKPYFRPLAACAIAGVYLIVFPQNPLARSRRCNTVNSLQPC